MAWCAGVGGTNGAGRSLMADSTSRRKLGSKVSAEPPVRQNRPREIAALVAPLLRPVLRRKGPAVACLIEDWDALVGPDIAAVSFPVQLVGGTLRLACNGPTALELQHRAPALIARLNLALGGTPIERLRFVAGFPMATDKGRPMTQQIRNAEGSPPSRKTAEQGLAAALERLRHALEQR